MTCLQSCKINYHITSVNIITITLFNNKYYKNSYTNFSKVFQCRPIINNNKTSINKKILNGITARY